MTLAERAQMIMDLSREWILLDEDGNEVERIPPLISAETARKLWEYPDGLEHRE